MLRKPTPEASLAADRRHIPLVVTNGFEGYRLAYAAGEFHQPVLCACCSELRPLEWPTPTLAELAGRIAITSTNELLARVLQS